MKSPSPARRGSAGRPGRGAGLAGPLALAVALAFEGDLVGVVGEAIDGALGEDRIIEERDPLVDRPVRGNDRRGATVALEDDFVEVARLLGIEAAQREVVDDEDVGSEEAAEHPLGGVIGAGLVEVLEEVVGAQEEDVAAGAAGGVSQRAGEKRFPDADGAEEDGVLMALEEAETEEVADAIAIKGNGGVPVEAFQVLLLLESGAVESEGEIRASGIILVGSARILSTVNNKLLCSAIVADAGVSPPTSSPSPTGLAERLAGLPQRVWLYSQNRVYSQPQ